jgi:FkbH-like protein
MYPSIADLPWLPSPPADFAERCRDIGASTTQPGAVVQFLAGFRSSPRQAALLGRAIARCRSAQLDLAPLTAVRLGILASATFDLLLDCLPVAAARHGVALDLVATPYDQVAQQALDPASSVNIEKLDAILIAVDHRWLNLGRPGLHASHSGRVPGAIDRLRTVIGALRVHGRAPSILQTLPTPPEALFGSYDRRVRGTVRAMIDEFNQSLLKLADQTDSYVLDVASLAERVGTDRWFDPVQWAAYKLPFGSDFFPAYADILGRLLGAMRGKTRKCLVLDLDNTIWGGVIGDDGLAGIEIGQGHARGEAFLNVQQTAIELRERGIILAVCSKNDDITARGPFREHPDMALRENHIAIFQANWTDKASNLEAIAKALNIGLDALVLLDDNPAERAEVRAALPAVAVPELPDDPGWFAWYLTAAGYFEAVNFSVEDGLRAESYASDARRTEVMASSRDLGAYLQSLDMIIGFDRFDPKGRQRIAQLINKTNQFNLTTRRYTEAEVAAMESDESIFTLQTRLADKFGDLGMIGVIICRAAKSDRSTWEIDTWLMSCRVLGRGVEQAMLAKLATEATKRGVRRLIGDYIPTAKNSMVADHYGRLGFTQLNQAGSNTRWALSLSNYVAPALAMRMNDGFLPGTAPAAATG